MKILQISFIIFICFVFQTNAQLCGTYGTTLKINDKNGKPISNPRFVITPLQKLNRIGGQTFEKQPAPAEFKITFSEGFEVSGKYKVKVSAKGFGAAEKELIFPACALMKYEVILTPLKSESKSIFRQLVEIRGELWTEKIRNSSVNLTATGGDGKIYKTKSDENGIYALDLPLGNYTLVYEKVGYETLKVENVVIAEHRNIYIYNAKINFLGKDKHRIVIKDFKDLYTSFNL